MLQATNRPIQNALLFMVWFLRSGQAISRACHDRVHKSAPAAGPANCFDRDREVVTA
jgi:hypothetical protein